MLLWTRSAAAALLIATADPGIAGAQVQGQSAPAMGGDVAQRLARLRGVYEAVMFAEELIEARASLWRMGCTTSSRKTLCSELVGWRKEVPDMDWSETGRAPGVPSEMSGPYRQVG